MSDEMRKELQKSVNGVSDEYWGYFCYEDYWCETANQTDEPCDCEDCNKAYHGDDYDPELDDPVYCECGGCEKHHGSLLDVDITRSADGTMRGVIAVVGVGGPRIELNTRQQMVIGYWGKEVARSTADKDTCQRVEQFFDDLGM